MARGKYQNAVASWKSTKNTPIPNSIKCNRCSVVKNKDAFSSNMQQTLAGRIEQDSRFDASRTAYVACKSCTGGQIYELRCTLCDVVKGKDAFNKTQRRVPDTAICEPCMQDRLNTEPGERDSDNEDDSDGSVLSLDDESEVGGSTVAASMNGLSLTGSSTTASNTLGTGRTFASSSAGQTTNTSSMARLPKLASSRASSAGGWSSATSRETATLSSGPKSAMASNSAKRFPKAPAAANYSSAKTNKAPKQYESDYSDDLRAASSDDDDDDDDDDIPTL